MVQDAAPGADLVHHHRPAQGPIDGQWGGLSQRGGRGQQIGSCQGLDRSAGGQQPDGPPATPGDSEDADRNVSEALADTWGGEGASGPDGGDPAASLSPEEWCGGRVAAAGAAPMVPMSLVLVLAFFMLRWSGRRPPGLR